ncbi:ABC transporter ATP-binding protein [bacterium]|nr:ABC transporter ATP-binding protein [bacterium]
MNNILKAENLTKKYPLPRGSLCVFDGLQFEISPGDLVAIMGVSGVGKTTLLNLFGALDKPTQGKIFLEGEDILTKSDKEIAEIRNQKIGFIFQFYHLLPEFNSLENVAFPLMIKGVEKNESLDKAFHLLQEVGLEGKEQMKPGKLSGGEQQRVAIARALVNEPSLLLADEPTGNLDRNTEEKILKLVQNLHQRKGLASILVTHNEKVARFCQKVYLMEGGGLKQLSDF